MPNKTYRTAKGTELPILNLDGRDYLEVKYRLVWFREEHPDWSIETELFNVTDVSAYGRAVIRDETSRIMATSHKFESITAFPDFIERAETGSIGRALALVGYGTQFCADELEDAQKPGVAVQQTLASPSDALPLSAGAYRVNFGRKFKGKKLSEIKRSELEGYMHWLEESGIRQGTVLEQKFQALKDAVVRFYGSEYAAA